MRSRPDFPAPECREVTVPVALSILSLRAGHPFEHNIESDIKLTSKLTHQAKKTAGRRTCKPKVLNALPGHRPRAAAGHITLRQANALKASQQDSSGRKVLSFANIAVHGRQLPLN